VDEARRGPGHLHLPLSDWQGQWASGRGSDKRAESHVKSGPGSVFRSLSCPARVIFASPWEPTKAETRHRPRREPVIDSVFTRTNSMAQRWQRSTNAPAMRTAEPTLAPMPLECTAASGRDRCWLGHSCEPAPLYTATCSRAPDVRQTGCAHRPSNLSLALRPSGEFRHQPDRCVHRGATPAADR
jgi:hypothetical protein